MVKSSLIHASKVNTFNYVNDFQNWEDFMNLGTNESVRNSFTKNSIGKGAKYSWEGTEENGSVQTFLVKENDSISQKMDLDGSEFHLTWVFKAGSGGTTIIPNGLMPYAGGISWDDVNANNANPDNVRPALTQISVCGDKSSGCL